MESAYSLWMPGWASSIAGTFPSCSLLVLIVDDRARRIPARGSALLTRWCAGVRGHCVCRSTGERAGRKPLSRLSTVRGPDSMPTLRRHAGGPAVIKTPGCGPDTRIFTAAVWCDRTAVPSRGSASSRMVMTPSVSHRACCSSRGSQGGYRWGARGFTWTPPWARPSGVRQRIDVKENRKKKR